MRLLRDLWHEQTPPADSDELGLLRYRSNLLGADAVAACAVDISSRDSIRCMFQDTVRRFGGLDIIVNSPWCKCVVAPRPVMRPAGKARDARIWPIFERRATQPGGMQRRSNADGLAPRAVNTAAVFPSPDSTGRITDAQWHSTLTLRVTANYLLADEAAAVLDVQ